MVGKVFDVEIVDVVLEGCKPGLVEMRHVNDLVKL